MTKSLLRNKMKELFKKSKFELIYKNESFKVVTNIKNFLQQNNFQKIGSYMAINHEVDLSYIHDNYHAQYAIPSFVDNEYKLCLIDDFSSLKKGKYNIMESAFPYNKAKDLDCCLIPLISCDRSGVRLGHGNGYYDKILKDVSFVKIGICFECQIVPNIIKDEWDILLDVIISENKVYLIK